MASEEHEFLLSVLKGHEEAAQMCEMIFYVSQVWDDVIDGDPINQEDKYEVFRTMLIDLPANPFYRHYIGELLPLFETFVADWQTANELEKGSDHDKSIAFILRDSVCAIVVYCAGIVGGYKWREQMGPVVRRYAHDEGLEEYKDQLKLDEAFSDESERQQESQSQPE